MPYSLCRKRATQRMNSMLVTHNIPVMQRHLKICIAHANILSDRMNKNKKDSLCQAFLGPIWSKRTNEEAGEVEQCLQLGMSQCTTPLTAVKPLRFP
jgi:hypothetical protein